MNPLFIHVFELGCDDVDDVVSFALCYKDVNHEDSGRHRVRRVDSGAEEVVDELWRVVGRDRTERKRALEVEASGGVM